MLELFKKLKNLQAKPPRTSVSSWIQNEANMNKKPKMSAWKMSAIKKNYPHQSTLREASKAIRPNKGKIHFSN